MAHSRIHQPSSVTTSRLHRHTRYLITTQVTIPVVRHLRVINVSRRCQRQFTKALHPRPLITRRLVRRSAINHTNRHVNDHRLHRFTLNIITRTRFTQGRPNRPRGTSTRRANNTTSRRHHTLPHNRRFTTKRHSSRHRQRVTCSKGNMRAILLISTQRTTRATTTLTRSTLSIKPINRTFTGQVTRRVKFLYRRRTIIISSIRHTIITSIRTIRRLVRMHRTRQHRHRTRRFTNKQNSTSARASTPLIIIFTVTTNFRQTTSGRPTITTKRVHRRMVTVNRITQFQLSRQQINRRLTVFVRRRGITLRTHNNKTVGRRRVPRLQQRLLRIVTLKDNCRTRRNRIMRLSNTRRVNISRLNGNHHATHYFLTHVHIFASRRMDSSTSGHSRHRTATRGRRPF